MCSIYLHEPFAFVEWSNLGVPRLPLPRYDRQRGWKRERAGAIGRRVVLFKGLSTKNRQTGLGPLSKEPYPNTRVVSICLFFLQVFENDKGGSECILVGSKHTKHTVWASILANMMDRYSPKDMFQHDPAWYLASSYVEEAWVTIHQSVMPRPCVLGLACTA